MKMGDALGFQWRPSDPAAPGLREIDRNANCGTRAIEASGDRRGSWSVRHELSEISDRTANLAGCRTLLRFECV